MRALSAFRKEFSALLVLALPILGAQLAQTGNAFVDTVMAGRVGAVDLAAVAVGASAWVPVYLFMTGVLMAGTSVLSRHIGSGDLQRLNPIAQQLLYLALLLGTIGFVLLRNFDPLLVAMDVDPELLPKVSGYLRALSWGMPGAALVIALRAYTEALSNPRPVLLISIAGLLLNIPANYILIYGKLGVPAMGGVGCGWATTLVFWFMAISLALYIALHGSYQSVRLDLRQRYFEPKTIVYLTRLGLPVGLSIFFEISIFTVIALLISQLGAEVVAGHQIALNFTGLIFMVPLSFALAATVRVGLARGQRDPAVHGRAGEEQSAQELRRDVRRHRHVAVAHGCRHPQREVAVAGLGHHGGAQGLQRGHGTVEGACSQLRMAVEAMAAAVDGEQGQCEPGRGAAHSGVEFDRIGRPGAGLDPGGRTVDAHIGAESAEHVDHGRGVVGGQQPADGGWSIGERSADQRSIGDALGPGQAHGGVDRVGRIDGPSGVGIAHASRRTAGR